MYAVIDALSLPAVVVNAGFDKRTVATRITVVVNSIGKASALPPTPFPHCLQWGNTQTRTETWTAVILPILYTKWVIPSAEVSVSQAGSRYVSIKTATTTFEVSISGTGGTNPVYWIAIGI